MGVRRSKRRRVEDEAEPLIDLRPHLNRIALFVGLLLVVLGVFAIYRGETAPAPSWLFTNGRPTSTSTTWPGWPLCDAAVQTRPC